MVHKPFVVPLLQRLDRIQNQALRIIAKVPKCTPIDSLYTKLAVPPLEIRRQSLLLKYWLKTKTYVSDSPVSQLTPANLNHIGLKSKSTQNLGDSFVTFVSKIAAESGILNTH